MSFYLIRKIYSFLMGLGKTQRSSKVISKVGCAIPYSVDYILLQLNCPHRFCWESPSYSQSLFNLHFSSSCFDNNGWLHHWVSIIPSSILPTKLQLNCSVTMDQELHFLVDAWGFLHVFIIIECAFITILGKFNIIAQVKVDLSLITIVVDSCRMR